ncbi:MAG: TonB-dependent receptor domain-containing protein [Terriglobia bacterium]
MRLFWVAPLILILAISALAQTPTGTLQGTVVDQSGGAIPGAAVRVVNNSTNVARNLTTDSLGRFVLPFLTPGTYTVSASAKGFRTVEEQNIEISVSQIRSLSFSLRLGQISQTVEVESTTPPLNTSTGTLGTVVGTSMLMDLPLQGRNPLSLAELVPTVNNTGNASTPHIGGSRNAVNEEQINGVSNILPENNVGNTTAAYTPIVDSVEEFSVDVNSLSAEYGRFGGGVINLVTKPGTNQVHGGLFEFLQNSALDANDFFSNRAGGTKAVSRENQWGGTLGGPIYIPHLYNGRDRTFFFFGFQGTNQASATTSTATVPIMAFRNGDFTSLGTTIYDPATIALDPATGEYTRSAFAGNMIDPSRFNSVAVKAMNYFPLPNAGAPGAQTNNYFISGSVPNHAYQFDSRVDHTFSPKWQSFLTVSHAWGYSGAFSIYGTGADAAADTGDGPVNSGAWAISMDHTITLSPTLILDMRYGFSRSTASRLPISLGFNPTTELGLPQYVTSQAAQRDLQFPTFGFSTGASEGSNYDDLIENPSAHIVLGNLTKVTGHHTIKFGGEYRKLYINFQQYGYADGQYNFDQTWTQYNPTAANGTGSAYAAALLGLATSGHTTEEPSAAEASSYTALYIQDTWKVTPKLTLDPGLRWEIESPRTERYNRISYWNPNLPSPLQGKVSASAACPNCGDLVGQMLFPGNTGKYGRHQGPTQWKDFGPRFGLAWNPLSKTVIRSGFGIVFAPSVLEAAGTTGSPGVEGFNPSTNMLPTTDNQRTILATLSNPYPTGYIGDTPGNPSTDIGNGIGDSYFDSYRNPYSIEWNFNIEQQLPGQITLEVGYLGNHGLFLANGDPGVPYDQLNPSNLALGNALYNVVANPFYGLITTPGSPLSQPTIQERYLLRPYPQYNGVESFRKPDAMSMYNGFTLRLEKHFSHGFDLLASFTGSKTMDDSSAAVSYLGPVSETYVNQYDPRLEWSISSQDVSRAFVGAFVYELPFGKGRTFVNSASRGLNLLISGWEVNGIITLQDGTPLLMSGAQDQTGLFTLGQTPDNTGSAKLSNPTISKWFNTSVFYQPPPFSFGNTSRSLPNVRNPGIRNADVSLFKNDYFGKEDRYNVQFRVEAFKALNNPQWGGPNTNIRSGGAFGTITSDTGPRNIQLALKFLW